MSFEDDDDSEDDDGDLCVTIATGQVDSVSYRGPVSVTIAQFYCESEDGSPDCYLGVTIRPCEARLSYSRSFRAEVLRVLQEADALDRGDYELVPEPSYDATHVTFRDLRRGGSSVLRSFYERHGITMREPPADETLQTARHYRFTFLFSGTGSDTRWAEIDAIECLQTYGGVAELFELGESDCVRQEGNVYVFASKLELPAQNQDDAWTQFKAMLPGYPLDDVTVIEIPAVDWHQSLEEEFRKLEREEHEEEAREAERGDEP
jgi:hypothetical protein